MRISSRVPLPLAPSGAPESPRAQPTESKKKGCHCLRAVDRDAITSWLTVDPQSDRQMMCAGAGPLTLLWFFQHLIGLLPRRI